VRFQLETTQINYSITGKRELKLKHKPELPLPRNSSPEM
jgi:hypothetical protein